MSKSFCIKIPVGDSNPEAIKDFNDFMDEWQNAQFKYEEAERLGISVGVASYILYLRTRSHHTQDMEDYLIYLDQNNLAFPEGITSGEWDYETDVGNWLANKKKI